MLVLTRKRDETIQIGSNIVIRVIKTAKGSVKIGIEAPDSVRIKRGEIATLDAEGGEADTSFELNYEDSLDGSMFAAMLVQS